jgi:hypothetical protein
VNTTKHFFNYYQNGKGNMAASFQRSKGWRNSAITKYFLDNYYVSMFGTGILLPVVQKDIQVQGLSNFAEIKPVAFYI